MAAEERVESARERILATAIEFIEREGTAKATTRAIAAMAGVNVAAINYYFGSKDALIKAVLSQTFGHAMEDLQAFLEAEPWEPRSCLLSIATYLIEGAEKFPRITMANLFDSKGRPFESVAKGFGILVDRLAERLCAHFAVELEDRRRDQVLAFLSATVLPILVPVAPNRLAASETRNRYLATIVEGLLSGFGAALPL